MNDFNAYFRQNTCHPNVGVGDLSRAELSLFDPIEFDMYCVVLMDSDFGKLVRGGQSVAYLPGTLFSIRPGQVVSMNLNYKTRPNGWMLAFREDLLVKTGLGRDFYMFDFFNQDVNNALGLSKMERGIIMNCYANIASELLSERDYLSDQLLRLGIGQLLSYYKRFFERQYAERMKNGNHFRQKLEMTIDNYLSSGSASQHGLPTVAWCAAQFNLSANYFGDLVKREMQITAQDYIQAKVVETALHLLNTTEMPVNEIAQELGFYYPNHFNRMFRKKMGLTPLQYRKNNQQEEKNRK